MRKHTAGRILDWPFSSLESQIGRHVMRYLFGVICAACFVAIGCNHQPSGSQSSDAVATRKPEELSANSSELGGFIVGKPITWENLTIYPVVSSEPKNEDHYITLEEGLKAGTVEVFEVGAQIENEAEAAENVEASADPTELAEPALEGPSETVSEPAAPNAVDDPFADLAREGPTTSTEADISEEEVAGDSVATPSVIDVSENTEDEDETAGEDPFGAPMQQTEYPLADPFGPNDEEVAGDVNRLTVVNRSEKPLYLMPGEVIYGGKQDRAIAEETIILADGKPVSVEVYCVERGRWSGRSTEMANAGIAMLAYGGEEAVDQETVEELVEQTRKGNFVVKAGNLGQAGRMAVQAKKGQDTVWREVGAANAAAGVQTESDTFTANYTDKNVGEKAQKYVGKIEAPVAEQNQVVGAIVAINGEIKAVDVFGSTPLFRRVWPKLLRGHVLDAIAAADSPQSDEPSTREKAKTFMAAVMNADVENRTEGGLVVTKREDDSVLSYSAEDPAAMMGGMGGFGGAVHSSGYAKQ
jgi:hypothetical protein